MYAALILAAVGFVPANPPLGDARLDNTLIQGRWEYVSVQYDGQPFPLEKGDHIVISGRKWSIHRNGLVIKLEHSLDPSGNPKRIDLVVERDGRTFRLEEIYKREDDKLTLCELPRPEAPRPTTFSAEKRQKQFLIILKRSSVKEK